MEPSTWTNRRRWRSPSQKWTSPTSCSHRSIATTCPTEARLTSQRRCGRSRPALPTCSSRPSFQISREISRRCGPSSTRAWTCSTTTWRRSSGNDVEIRGGERTTEEGMLRIVDVDGTYDSKMEPKLPAEVLKTAYRHLVLVRTLDTRMLSLQRQGRIGFYVPSTGEEACQIGSAMALEKRDWVFPAYREPGAAIWRGFPLETLIAQAYGNAQDPQYGRQMPNHFGSASIRYVTTSSPVGTQITQAVGTAWAAKIRKE